MTIQRLYSLPNCKLVLEGLTNDPLGGVGGRPLVSVVTSAECYVAGYEQPLTGGRDFLESLVTAVSSYAQDYLSGIHHRIRRDRHRHPSLVQLERIDDNLHRLTVEPAANPDGQASEAAPAQFDLTTVQLFDLVEAVDQFFADAQTMPDLALTLTPLSKRFVAAQEPVAERAVPAAIGISSLALAAVALFFMPTPPVRRPEAASKSPTPQESAIAASPSASAATASPSPTASVDAAASSPASPTPSPTAQPSTAESPTAESNASASQEAGVVLADASAITDPKVVDQLNIDLYDKIDRAWKTQPTFKENLIYRVGVSKEGKIVGYKSANDAAANYVDEIPLLDLLELPGGGQAANSSNSSEPAASPSVDAGPLAQFRVVFKPNGVLEVSPWYGQAPTTSGTDSSTPVPSSSPSSQPSP
jgi:hypothetical protein